MRNLTKIIFIIFILFSFCTPKQQARSSQKKLNKLIKKHPELARLDTIKKDTIIDIPSIEDSVALLNKPDNSYSKVDSLTSHFASKIDSEILDSLNTGFKTILNKVINIDTTIKTKKAYYHITEKDGMLKIDLKTEPQKKKIKYKQVNKTVTAKEIPTWWERACLHIGKDFIGIVCSLLILLLLIGFYKFIKNEVR